MASVYKTKGRDGKKHPVWRFKFRDCTGHWRYGTGWPDRKKTLEHALTLEAEHRAIRKGEKEACPSWLKARNRPVGEVIEENLAWGRAQGGRGRRPWDSKNAYYKERYFGWWVGELGLTILADIALARVEKVVRKLLEKLSPKSVALKVEALRCLCV